MGLVVPFFDKRSFDSFFMKMRDEPLSPLGTSYIFGNTASKTGSITYEGSNNAMFAAPVNGDGYLKNMSAFFYCANSGETGVVKLKFALYQYVDYSSSYAGTKLIESEELQLTTNYPGIWLTCNFTDYWLINGTNYYLALTATWISGNTVYLGRSSTSGGTTDIYENMAYGFEDPWLDELTSSRRRCIYATYTPIVNETRTITQIFDNWWVGANESYRVITEIFNNYFLGANESYRVITQVGDNWWLGANESYRVITEIGNYWWLCGNGSYRVPTEIINSWWLGENGSTRPDTQVFNYWWTGSNESYRVMKEITNYWWVGSNESYRVIKEIFNYWWLCANESYRVDTQLFDYWWNCGNGSYRVSTQVFDYYWLGEGRRHESTQVFDHWWLCGNESYRTIEEITNYWWLGGNGSYRVGIQVFDSWWLGNNWTHEPYQLTDYWWIGENSSYRVSIEIINSWWTGDNYTSISVITITSVYPSNNSRDIPVTPVLYAIINNSQGNSMNISWYYGDSLDNCTILLGSNNGFVNSTQYQLDSNASNNGTRYYFRLMVEDGISYVNESITFTTGIPVMRSPSTGNAFKILGIFSILGVLVFIRMRRRRRRNED